MRFAILALLLLSLTVEKTVAFLPSHQLSANRPSSTSRFAAAEEPGIWTTKNDFRTFMNQCTIQSFLFLVSQMRDVHTVAWVEDFTQPTIILRRSDMARNVENYQTGEFVEPDEDEQRAKLLHYHGLGAMDETIFENWDNYFLDLLKEDKEEWTVESTRAHIPTYDMEINPASLCARMISVREQIAKEWVNDLGVMAKMSRRVMESYFEKLREQQEAGLRDTIVKIERQDILFLEWDPNEDSDFAPSPLRKGNFDLLVLLTTQEAVHRILNDREQLEGPALVSHTFLKEFYSERLPTHFIGGQRYGRADEFLEELMSTPPSMITTQGMNSLVDPMRVAQMILKKREDVALEWQEISRGSPDEHFGIRRMMLNKLMGISD